MTSNNGKTLISLDCFDTAIVRKTYLPTGIFELIEEKVGNDFKEKRIKAEKTAYDELGFGYTLEQIYGYIPEFDMNLEIETEISNCLPNPLMYESYKNTDLKENEIIFISDMYLPSTVITQMLEKCGYENPRVFVSCENKAHKGDGGLFKVVEKEVGKIEVHFGDNYIADILGARQAKIKPFYIPALQNLKTNVPPIKNTKLKKLLVQNEQYPPYAGTEVEKLNKKTAYYFTPMVYSFTKWVLDNRKEGQKIFFNARDGYLPFQIAKNIFKAEDIYYINASRKSVLNSSMNFDIPIQENRMQFERLLIQRTDSIENLLKSINYTKKDLKIKDNNVEKFVIKNQEKLYKHFKQNKENAIKYFNKFNISDNDIIVDIGYFGTIQYAIEQITGKKLSGYYLQTFEEYELNIERHSYFQREVARYCLLVESFFSSPEDGVSGYDKKGNPVYYVDSEKKKEFSKLVHDEIMPFAQYLHDENIDPSIKDVEALTIRFLYYPTLDECHYCNEPIFENGDIINHESVVWYDRNEIKRGKLQDCYNKSYWKPAFLKLLQNDKELSSLEKFLIVNITY